MLSETWRPVTVGGAVELPPPPERTAIAIATIAIATSGTRSSQGERGRRTGGLGTVAARSSTRVPGRAGGAGAASAGAGAGAGADRRRS